MGLKKSVGDMYPWVDYTWNPLGGKCPHNCIYCYTKKPPVSFSSKYSSGKLRIWEGELKVNLGSLKVTRRVNLPYIPNETPIVFICSNSDLGIASLRDKARILEKCSRETGNFYLIQSKNPYGLIPVREKLPLNTIAGTTIETDNETLARKVSNAPPPTIRAKGLVKLETPYKMVSIEPVIDFTPVKLYEIIKSINPDFVSIGADTGGNNLPEPPAGKIMELIELLRKHTLTLKKKNLNRILVEEEV